MSLDQAFRQQKASAFGFHVSISIKGIATTSRNILEKSDEIYILCRCLSHNGIISIWPLRLPRVILKGGLCSSLKLIILFIYCSSNADPY